MQEDPSILDLKVDEEAKTNLTELSRWARFMGILVLTAVGLFFLMFVFLWNKLDRIFFAAGAIEPGTATQVKGILIVVMVIVAAIIAVLMSFLIKGASRIRAGLRSNDQFLFTSGLSSLKNYFIMYGVLGIIGLMFNLTSVF